jgi:hypothetical protein
MDVVVTADLVMSVTFWGCFLSLLFWAQKVSILDSFC